MTNQAHWDTPTGRPPRVASSRRLFEQEPFHAWPWGQEHPAVRTGFYHRGVSGYLRVSLDMDPLKMRLVESELRVVVRFRAPSRLEAIGVGSHGWVPGRMIVLSFPHTPFDRWPYRDSKGP